MTDLSPEELQMLRNIAEAPGSVLCGAPARHAALAWLKVAIERCVTDGLARGMAIVFLGAAERRMESGK